MIDDRLPPYHIQAEEGVLTAILVHPYRLEDVRPIIKLEDFFREEHRWIYEAFLVVAPDINEITVAHELAQKGRLEGIGGAAKLSYLVATMPTSVYAEPYARIVAKEAHRRRLIDAAGRIEAMAYEGDADSIELQAKALEILTKIVPPGRQDTIEPAEHAETMLNTLDRCVKQEFTCVPFGYRDLDSFVSMSSGDLVLVGARPGFGKSQVLLEVALHNARQGRSVLFCSAEMPLEQLEEREIVMATGADIQRLRRGELTDSEKEQAQAVVDEASKLPLRFLSGGLNVAKIAQQAKFTKQTKGLDIVLVDYIQLLRDKTDTKAGDSVRVRIGFISSELKNLARDLDVPVLAACQLNREVESRPGYKPLLSDLKESGDLEQDADIVLLLHRPEFYPPYESKGILEVGIAKVRQGGQTGTIKLAWAKQQHQYRDKTK